MFAIQIIVIIGMNLRNLYTINPFTIYCLYFSKSPSKGNYL